LQAIGAEWFPAGFIHSFTDKNKKRKTVPYGTDYSKESTPSFIMSLTKGTVYPSWVKSLQFIFI